MFVPHGSEEIFVLMCAGGVGKGAKGIGEVLPAGGARDGTHAGQCAAGTIEMDFNIAADAGAGAARRKGAQAVQIDSAVGRPVAVGDARQVLSAFRAGFGGDTRHCGVTGRHDRNNRGVTAKRIGESRVSGGKSADAIGIDYRKSHHA